MSGNPRCRGLSLLSGGLDSQLAVRVLERAGAHVEGVTFSTPFFDCAAARKAAAALGIESGFVQPGEKVGLFGIGSGVNVVLAALEWNKTLPSSDPTPPETLARFLALNQRQRQRAGSQYSPHGA